MAAVDPGTDAAAAYAPYGAGLNRETGACDYMVKVIRGLNPGIEILADNAAVDPDRDFEWHSHLVAGITRASSTHVRFIDKIEEFYLKLVQKLRAPLAEAEEACRKAMALEKEKDETIARLQKEKDEDDAIERLQKGLDDVIEWPNAESHYP